MQTLPFRVSYRFPHQPRRTDLLHWLRFKRDWELGTLESTQRAFLESMFNRLGVNLCLTCPQLPVWN